MTDSSNPLFPSPLLAAFLQAAEPKRFPVEEVLDYARADQEQRRLRAQGVPRSFHPHDADFVVELRLRLWSDEQSRNNRDPKLDK